MQTTALSPSALLDTVKILVIPLLIRIEMPYTSSLKETSSSFDLDLLKGLHK